MAGKDTLCIRHSPDFSTSGYVAAYIKNIPRFSPYVTGLVYENNQFIF